MPSPTTSRYADAMLEHMDLRRCRHTFANADGADGNAGAWKSPFTETELHEIASIVERASGVVYDYNPAARLSHIDASGATVNMVFGETSFLPFVATNMLSVKAAQIDRFLAYAGDARAYDLVSNMRTWLRGSEAGIIGTVNSQRYSGVVAVSVMVRDPEENVLVVRRSGLVGVGTWLTCVSCTGTAVPEDCRADNPVIACAQRELEEELGVFVPDDRMELVAVVMDSRKRQPAFLLNGRIDFPIREILLPATSALDRYENLELIACAPYDAKKIMLEEHASPITCLHAAEYL